VVVVNVEMSSLAITVCLHEAGFCSLCGVFDNEIAVIRIRAVNDEGEHVEFSLKLCYDCLRMLHEKIEDAIDMVYGARSRLADEVLELHAKEYEEEYLDDYTEEDEEEEPE